MPRKINPGYAGVVVIARFGKLPKEIKDKIYKLALVIKMDGSEPAMLIALRGDKSYDKFKEFYDSANFDLTPDTEEQLQGMKKSGVMKLRHVRIGYPSPESIPTDMWTVQTSGGLWKAYARITTVKLDISHVRARRARFVEHSASSLGDVFETIQMMDQVSYFNGYGIQRLEIKFGGITTVSRKIIFEKLGHTFHCAGQMLFASGTFDRPTNTWTITGGIKPRS